MRDKKKPINPSTYPSKYIDGFDALYNDHYDYIYRLAYRILKDPDSADDVTQEAFEKIWKNLSKAKADNFVSFKAWLKRITTNEALQYIQKNKKHRSEPLVEERSCPRQRDNASDDDRSEKIKIIEMMAINLKNPEVRETVMLHYLEDKTTVEISKGKSVPLGTVLWRVANFRKKVLAYFEKRGLN